MTALEKHLFLVQQKLEHLTSEVATLVALTSTQQPHADGSTKAASNNQLTDNKPTSTTRQTVGINRYRQLMNEHTDQPRRGLTSTN